MTKNNEQIIKYLLVKKPLLFRAVTRCDMTGIKHINKNSYNNYSKATIEI